MSKIITQSPIVHIPSFKRWAVHQNVLLSYVYGLGLDTLVKTNDFILSAWYYYTDIDGWAKIIPDLIVSSSLYDKNVFACEEYALKAQIECGQRYRLNTLRLCIGKVEGHADWHGFDIFFYGNEKGIGGAMLFEPDDGYEWAGNAFPIGEFGYVPKLVFLASKPKEVS